MKRQKNRVFAKVAQPFSRWWAHFRAEVIVVPMEDPLEPIMSVNDDVLTLRTGFHTRRNTILLPWLLGLTILTYVVFNGLWPSVEGMKEWAEKKVEFNRENIASNERRLLLAQQQGDIEKQKFNQMMIEWRENEIRSFMVYLNKEGEPTLFTYLKAQSIRGDLGYALGLIIMPCVFGLLALGCWGMFLFKPRDAEIYFDRRRGIVYTWRHGRVGAARFEHMGIKENMIGLGIYLQFENKKQDGYWPMAIVGIDAGKIVFHKEDDVTYLLAQLLAFMENGKEVVITNNSFQRAPAKYFLFEDKKPENFEQRLVKVLESSHNLVETYENNVIKGHAL